MAIIGVRIQKKNTLNFKFENRYYVLATDVEEALLFGERIVQIEREIFSSSVTFYNIHTWLPGANPNQKRNLAQSTTGVITGANNLKPEIVARMYFGGQANENPNFKNYRIQLPTSKIIGYDWETDVFGYFVNYLDAALELEVPFCTNNGELIAPATFDNQYQFQQLSKKWYNRT